ncbi:hypothetical protein CKO44_06420 [Rubrivivax gelatinosus]|nr:hypothetical protein [Rubrivivax gelatinosus]MBZ8142885.1 hypothetical protein [Rubrivivax gelatinosus]
MDPPGIFDQGLAMIDQPRPEGQLDVQRWLGRCMLRLQQYERLMKMLLAPHELAGPVDTLEAQRAAKVEKVSDKTLGTLVKTLFESYAVPDGFERELLPEDKVPNDRIAMAMSYRITMTPERLAEVRAGIEALVLMRNELVHHFIERFDLWNDAGCAAALSHLESCYERIDRRHVELLGWVKSMDEARAHMAAFAQTEAFHDMMVAHHADQTPSKYGCRSWPQVLTECGRFDFAYRAGDDGRRVGWFRERPSS